MALMSGLQSAQRDVHVLAKCLPALVELHHTTSRVVLAMPNDLIAGGLVQDQSKWRLRLPHFSSDVVAPSQLVAEALAIRVDHQATHAAQGLGRQELHLGIRIVRLHQTSGMHLDPLQIDGGRANRFTHLNGITCAVFTVGGRQVQQVRAVGRQQGVRAKVGTKASGCQDHGSVLLHHLARLAVLAADHIVAALQQLEDLRLGDNPGAVGLFSHLLQHLNQRIGDGHPGKSFLSTVRARLRMATQTCHQ
mmetsp:Transcript_23601/g.48966  ORF Transcript_23601/g.48966 Transcript_23601/m.48966 type:complete len:249 (-) Transcript_23601:398-1144(-)